MKLMKMIKIMFLAQNIKKYNSNQPAFDFIIATLYKLAWADHVLDDSELELITHTNEIFKQRSSMSKDPV